MRHYRPVFVAALGLCFAACVESEPPVGPGQPAPGETDFITVTPGTSFGLPGAADAGAASAAGGSGGSSGSANTRPDGDRAPAGRVAEVEEADIYRMVGTRLYYFNTYRGFLIYDVADSKRPVLVSRLPVYGYPVEMFVEGNVVYALLRDALYLTESGGKLQFQRHNVSQLVTIDVGDPQAPRVLQTQDIVGKLSEGVSRKVGDTIYVVSQQWGYTWGWPGQDTQTREQAWVYSYDVSDPSHPVEAGKLQIFEGENRNDFTTPNQRWFSGVAISATSNALMVAENWYGPNVSGGCGGSDQEAVISIIDISDPKGTIRRHTRFSTPGRLDDQFKMTYRWDEATGQGTFFGIFSRSSWNGCQAFQTNNVIESWDVTDGTHPTRVGQLAFGKDDETVRASAFDLSRNVVYAITARQIDPLYAIDISDRRAIRVLSEIDGLSGSIGVFRLVAGGQFLLGVGIDQSASCSGPQDGQPGWQNTRTAASLIDVRDLQAIRLVQRKCIAIQDAGFQWSNVNWNQDQGHKMLGMFQDGDVNILTIPVSYSVKQDGADGNVGWWYRWETAVGLLTWDIARFDPAKDLAAQDVIQSFGTFVHPEGEVTRSILLHHPVTGERIMINLSDTHLSLANIQDLAQPRLESVVEVAPAINEIHAFGTHVVERVDSGGGFWSPQGRAEFRVKLAGPDLDRQAPVATFSVGQATAVYRYKNALVVLRRHGETGQVPPTGHGAEAVVYDLADPAHPRLASRTQVPFEIFNYYGFGCGVGWGYWFGPGEQTIVTGTGIASVRRLYHLPWPYPMMLAFLDLRDLDHPVVREQPIGEDADGAVSLVADPASDVGFYLTHRQLVDTFDQSGMTFSRFRYFAQRWEATPSALSATADVNLPGTLARTWVSGGQRLYLTHDEAARSAGPTNSQAWHWDTRLHLLRERGSRAELLDTRTFQALTLGSLVLEQDRLFVSGQPRIWTWPPPPNLTWAEQSDRLMILDLTAGTIAPVYDQPTLTYGVQLMGVQDDRLFLRLSGDGILITDVTDPARPRGLRFLRTLGWGDRLEFLGGQGYVPSSNFGVFQFSLQGPAELAAH